MNRSSTWGSTALLRVGGARAGRGERKALPQEGKVQRQEGASEAEGRACPWR